MSFFGVNVNPFSTPVGQRIEQATDGSLSSENWALNMEICDIINETEDGPRDAIKAIKRRLNQAAGKNYTIVMYTLTVLETCVKNCGKRFHALSCSREFVQELVKLIGPKNEPPTAVQEKVLSLIQTWADTFRNLPHTQGVTQVYQELKTKGIQFPMTDLDAMAPIITPERSVPESEQNLSSIPPEDQAALTAGPQHVQSSPNQLVQLSDQQLAKLQSELDVVQGNMRVLAEMLAYLTSPEQASNQKPDPADLELLTELHNTCKVMQQRVVDLIGKLAHDEMTAELLRINDELNNLFLRYSRYTKNKVPPSAILAQAMGRPPIAESSAVLGKQEAADSLIDLSDGVESLEKRVDAIQICPKGKEPDSDEFDMFAQSRNTTYETAKNSSSKYEDNLEQLSKKAIFTEKSRSLCYMENHTILNQESEFSEMAAWLDHTPGAQGDQSLTSSEFERFLAERAAAADALPTLPATTTTTSIPATSGTNIQRQINKDEDKSLFAL
ncbi:TOM1-like protein 2 isoform X3 [Belonocnema kinseyi]|uniref:TOM1-like protein 2 isoform X3 n=1 Tax=Belonocnema kinseyi TaxID=2817044 RepID=UPI00143CC5D0|nr:TOM1-like protein 2 isoform X3 [Belonocnema kinseyi]